MKVLEFLKKGSVIPDMAAQTKQEVLAEMATLIAQQEGVARADILRVLEDREKLGSTGIGEGVAIPHGTLNLVGRPITLFARSVKGVDFDAFDGQRTHLFFVLLTPDNNVGLKALARVSQLMRRPEFRASLVQAGDGDELYQLIMAEDSRL